ncbi:hypothetical protein GCM10025789_02400 [Tessaracoccus lubricantis]|uniref:DUF222 domain-containing protein n=1 Tax=Tessaracoccus lubricantis TaxID=545543 RepID=A0ABP9F0C1_9ACTN
MIADELLRQHLAERRAKAEKVALVAELAERYILPAGAEVVHGRMVDALVEEVYPVGGPGAPAISEFAPMEIAALLGVSTRRAHVMIDGAVHLKWQLPELFEQMRRLLVDADRAVQASYAVSKLPGEIARQVIRRWAAVQERYAWTGAFKKLDEMIAEADPSRAEDEARLLDERQVKLWVGNTGQSSHAVLGGVDATLDVLDAKLFGAAVAQIAALLKTVQGDESALDIRRAKAFGVLARPAYALALIQQGARQAADPELPIEPAGPDADADAAGQRYLPAGCAGHTCGTIDVPLENLLPKVTVDVVVEADAVGAHSVARIDDAITIATSSLATVLEGKQVNLRPVIDLPRIPAEDQYRPSVAMRRAVRALWRTEVFPYSTLRSSNKDLDHVVTFALRRGRGQTSLPNLVPVNRRFHRAKTAGLWATAMDNHGRAIQTSPLGYQYIVTQYGTEPVIPLHRYGRHIEGGTLLRRRRSA